MQALLRARNESPTEVDFLPNGTSADASYGIIMIANRTHPWSAIQFDKRLHAGFNRRLMNYLGEGGTRLTPVNRPYSSLSNVQTVLRKSADEGESTEGSTRGRADPLMEIFFSPR
jgi:hypothetical protein